VPITDLDAVRQHMAALDYEVSTSGPGPFPKGDQAYEPRFWINAQGLPEGRYEPLVLSWRSHDHTVFVPDPGFLMTYGLAPRSVGNGAVHWDDPAGPVRDIVKVSPPSVYAFPKRTHALDLQGVRAGLPHASQEGFGAVILGEEVLVD